MKRKPKSPDDPTNIAAVAFDYEAEEYAVQRGVLHKTQLLEMLRHMKEMRRLNAVEKSKLN